MRLQGTEIKVCVLIDIVYEISKYATTQAEAWLLSDAFNQVYSENQEQKWELNYLKSLKCPKMSTKLESQRICWKVTIKNNSNTLHLHQDKIKESLREF